MSADHQLLKGSIRQQPIICHGVLIFLHTDATRVAMQVEVILLNWIPDSSSATVFSRLSAELPISNIF